MGGIKNKLDKLSNKTLFKVPLWLKGDVRRKSDRGIVSDTNPLGSRLPSFSQPSEMLTRNISNTRKSNWWSLYASKTIGSLRLVALTKYLSIACLSLAILSTLILNIVNSYSSSKIESNAIDSNSEVSTLANNSSSISLSFSNATGSCSDTSNPANVCMSIPDGGGIATGGHTVTMATSTKVDSYNLSLSSTTDSTSLVNDDDSNATIPTISSSYPNSQELSNNSWGYSASTTSSTPPTGYSGLKPVSSPDYLLDSTLSTPEKVNEAINIIYGAMVKNPVALRAGNYAVALQYTATATIPAPQIASVNPNSYELGSNNDSRITITGQNLDSAYRVYIEGPLDTTGNPSTTSKQYDCTNLMGVVDGNYNYQLACNIPTDQTNPDLEPGDYTIHVVTQGGEDSIGFTYTEKQLPDGILQSTADYGSDGHVAVDYDENMIPITYIGNETTPKWVIADTSNSNSDTNLNWYDYPDKKWANAVTLTEEGLDKYKGQPVGTEIDEQYVLGYWVYIPRYAYEVMRPNAVDRVVAAQNFDIKFEVASDTKKVPAASCNLNIISMSQMWKSGHATHAGPTSSEILAKDYRSSCGIERDYPGDNDALANKTTWATHPAFTWQYMTEVNGFDKTVELNGIWIGKFEATGGETSPTILPNHPHIGEGDGMGRFFGIAKNIGYPDELNKYGDDVSTKANSHNFSTQSTHMTKNGEYAAAAYLSASKFGAGVNQVQINSQYADTTDDDGNESKGITGCGPSKSWNWSEYADTGTVGRNSACSKSNSKRAYNGSIGMLASSTGNVYGVYDMVGGGYDVVSAAWTNAPNEYLGTTFKGGVRPPYIDLYESSTFKATGAMWSLTRNDTGSYVYNDFDVCTWDTCGGKAMHEVKTVQSINGRNYTWGWEDSGDNDFPCKRYPILVLGLGAGDGSQDGPGAGVSIFATSTDYSVTFYLYAFRVTSISPAV